MYLYEKYCSLLPTIGTKADLYLLPLNKPTPWMWYGDRAIGLNTLHTTVKCLAIATGLEGKFTNHSLRATNATHLYQSGCPEKLIKEITGHHSNAVREYQRMPDSLKRAVSATISKPPENVKVAKIELEEKKITSENSAQHCLEQCITAATIVSMPKNIDCSKVWKLTVQANLEFNDQ